MDQPNVILDASIPTEFMSRPAQVPKLLHLNFQSPVDRVIVASQKVQKHPPLIFLGPRYASNYQLLRRYSFKQYEQRVALGYLEEIDILRRFKARLVQKREEKTAIGRPFNGMNSKYYSKDQLQFESDFQTGNLDAVFQVGQDEFDLFVRVDTNTKGHAFWFFFTLKNTRKGRNIRLNICNLCKRNCLLKQGYTPVFFSKSNKAAGWRRTKFVKFQNEKLRYTCLQQQWFNVLSFQIEPEADFDQVAVAYTLPYTYSRLLKTIDSVFQQGRSRLLIKRQTMTYSVGGLQIPLMMISSKSQLKSKQIIIVTARTHPGQTQGSFAAEGLLNFLIGGSQQADSLLQLAIVFVVPMLNPDGVVAGNYRCSLVGRDLNRKFNQNSAQKYPQIQGVKQLIQRIQHQFKKKVLVYVDLHGHSTQKNVFTYGPQYSITHPFYYNSRVFPKLFAKICPQFFRYFSCVFSIMPQKRTTARAVMLQNQIPYVFTLQTSVHGSYDHSQKKDIIYGKQHFLSIGFFLGKTLQVFVKTIWMHEKALQIRKIQRVNLRNQIKQRYKSITKRKSDNKQKKPKQIDETFMQGTEFSDYLEMLRQIEKEKHKKFQLASEGSSDRQSFQNDYPQDTLDKDLGLPSKQIQKPVQRPKIVIEIKNSNIKKTNSQREQLSLRQSMINDLLHSDPRFRKRNLSTDIKPQSDILTIKKIKAERPQIQTHVHPETRKPPRRRALKRSESIMQIQEISIRIKQQRSSSQRKNLNQRVIVDLQSSKYQHIEPIYRLLFNSIRQSLNQS